MYKYVEKLIENKKKGEIKRLGTLFSTKKRIISMTQGLEKLLN